MSEMERRLVVLIQANGGCAARAHLGQGKIEEEAGGMARGLDGYGGFLTDIKGRILMAQARVALFLNREAIWLQRQIGHETRQRQARHGWGEKVAAHLMADLIRQSNWKRPSQVSH